MDLDEQINECYDLHNYNLYQLNRIREELPNDCHNQMVLLDYIKQYSTQIRKEYCTHVCDYTNTCNLKYKLMED